MFFSEETENFIASLSGSCKYTKEFQLIRRCFAVNSAMFLVFYELMDQCSTEWDGSEKDKYKYSVSISLRMLSRLTSLHRNTVKIAIENLRNLGFIHYESGAKYRFWVKKLAHSPVLIHTHAIRKSAEITKEFKSDLNIKLFNAYVASGLIEVPDPHNHLDDISSWLLKYQEKIKVKKDSSCVNDKIIELRKYLRKAD